MGRVVAFLAVVGIVGAFLAGVMLAAKVDPSPIVLFAGFKFADGSMCSQTAWAALSKAAREAGVLVADGPRWKLTGTVQDALAQLGLEELA